MTLMELPKVTISMNSGHQLELDDGSQEVSLRHANGCVIIFNAGGQIEIQANPSRGNHGFGCERTCRHCDI